MPNYNYRQLIDAYELLVDKLLGLDLEGNNCGDSGPADCSCALHEFGRIMASAPAKLPRSEKRARESAAHAAKTALARARARTNGA